VTSLWCGTEVHLAGACFGSISALFGLTHGVIDQSQYSYLIAAVIGSAVIPMLIANAFFLPRYLLPTPATGPEAAAPAATASVEEAAR